MNLKRDSVKRRIKCRKLEDSYSYFILFWYSCDTQLPESDLRYIMEAAAVIEQKLLCIRDCSGWHLHILTGKTASAPQTIHGSVEQYLLKQ